MRGQNFISFLHALYLVLAVRIAPTVGDYCGLIFEKEDDDDQPTTTKTKSIKKVKILGWTAYLSKTLVLLSKTLILPSKISVFGIFGVGEASGEASVS